MNLFTGLNLYSCFSTDNTQSNTPTSTTLISSLSSHTTASSTLTTPTSVSGLSPLLTSALPVLPGTLFAAGTQTISLYTADGTPV